MIERCQKSLIEQRLRQFPAVAILGPRQAGKTTLAKELSAIYFDLEQEADRLQLDLRWSELTAGEKLIILDEAQTWPEIFPRLRGAIDARREAKGRFLLLGSVSPSLMKQVSESLAGRLALVELPPLSLAELPADHADKVWRLGGFPDGGILDSTSGAFPIWQQSYLKQLTHQDLPAWGLPSKPQQTEHLLRLLAAMHGTQLNASQLGQGLGVSYHTVQSQIDFLEGAFLIRRLRPYFANNFPKRLTKAPKLYWRDSGLLHHLLGLSANANLFDQRWVGNSWEGWVIEQILMARQSTGEVFNAWYFRTNDGLECDLIIESGDAREVIEIKLASTPSTEDFRKLEKIAGLVGATRQVLISRTTDQQVVESGSRWSTNLSSYIANFVSRQDGPTSLPSRSALTVQSIYQSLCDASGALRDRDLITNESLHRRATWLDADLELLEMPEFQILPSRWVDPGIGVRLPLVEYRFGYTGFSLDKAKDPFSQQKNSQHLQGIGLDREDLLYLSKVSEIGHTIIPHLWLSDLRLREDVRRPSQHINTLNEIWWLSRWQGIDTGSVQREYLGRKDQANLLKDTPSTIDWRFTVLGGQVAINLSVKNRQGTAGSEPLKKNVRLFDGKEGELGREGLPFPESQDDEINVLAITAYHGDWISRAEQEDLADRFFESLSRPCIDAIALSVRSGASEFSDDFLYFPKSRSLNKKDLILRAIFKPMDIEAQSRFGEIAFPRSLQDTIDSIQKSRSK